MFSILENTPRFSAWFQTFDPTVQMYACLCVTGLDLIAAFYGCLYSGCIPITVRPPHPQNISTTLPTVKMIVEVNTQTHIHVLEQEIYIYCFYNFTEL